MSKSTKRIITTVVCLLLCAAAMTLTKVQQDRVEQANRQPVNTVQRQQAATFVEGYERTMGPIETYEEGVKIGKAAAILCAYLDEDPSLEGAWTWGTDKLELSSDQAVAVIENGIHAYCPRHTPLLQAGE